jgi:hypothetical protein
MTTENLVTPGGEPLRNAMRNNRYPVLRPEKDLDCGMGCEDPKIVLLIPRFTRA